MRAGADVSDRTAPARGRARAGVLIVIAMLALGVGLTVLARAIRPPRTLAPVVIVTLDTLRADRLGVYGRTPTLTPNIDAFAARGVVFEQAWTTSPLTVPAHASLLTGLVPPLHGLRTNAAGARLPAAGARPYATLAETMRAAGARTAAFVSASVLRRATTGLDAGFDVYDDVPPAKPGAIYETERPGGETVAAALEWVRSGEGPFFLWVHLFDPHAPYDAPPPWGSGSQHAADARGYDGEVRYTDHCVGELLDGLADAGHADAVVVIASDHGEALGEHGEATHGYLLHEATLRVPLLLVAPGRIAPGVRRSEPVSLIDVPPTLLGLCGQPLPEWMGGMTLLPRGTPERRALYAESLYGWEGMRWAQVFALRVGPTKVVDAGPSTLGFDLERDPAENAPAHYAAVPDPGSPDADASAHRLVTDALRPRAELPAMGAPSTGSTGASTGSDLAGGSYWSGAGGPIGVLPREENAQLPSPYGRMDVLALLDGGRSAVAGGDPQAALASFESAAELDPTNPQAQRWRGRALLALQQPARAAQAYRRSFALGWRHPDCLAKALQASVQAVQMFGVESEVEAGLAFAAEARGQNVREGGPALVFEALLHIENGQFDAAWRAVRAAREEPSTAWLERAIEGTEEQLRAAGASPPR